MVLEGLRDKVYKLADRAVNNADVPEKVEKAMSIITIYSEIYRSSNTSIAITQEQQLKLQTDLCDKLEESLEMAQQSLTNDSLDKVIILMRALRHIV